jgi:hypothetical protein
MSTPKPPCHHEASAAAMADALNELRDSLVRLSLFVKDFQFEFDAEQRHAITEQSHELIEKIRPR